MAAERVSVPVVDASVHRPFASATGAAPVVRWARALAEVLHGDCFSTTRAAVDLLNGAATHASTSPTAPRTARAAASWPRLHVLGTSSQGVSQWVGSVAWGRCSYMAFAAASTAWGVMVTGGLRSVLLGVRGMCSRTAKSCEHPGSSGGRRVRMVR